MRTFKAAAGQTVKTLAIAALIGSATLVISPGVANADYRDCPADYLCLWGDVSYTGRYLFVHESNIDRTNIGSRMNDLTTSYWNRTDHTICLYEHTNYSGERRPVDPGASWHQIYPYFNDEISSFRVVQSPADCQGG